MENLSLILLKRRLKKEKFIDRAYIVGGYVRRLISGGYFNRKEIDLDVFLPIEKDEFRELFPSSANIIDKPEYTLVREDKIDFYIPKDPKISIEEDYKNRDFCCNSVYLKLSDGSLHDPSKRGISECREKVLTPTTTPIDIFTKDPLRMMRAIRLFCAEGFKFNFDSLGKFISSICPGWEELPIERIRDEFSKIITSGTNSGTGVFMLINSGLMDRIIPGFVENKSFEHRSKYHSMDWLDHTISVLGEVCLMKDLETSLSALLHDIAKPICFKDKEDGTRSYHGHEEESANISRDILKNLKYPNQVIDNVCFLIKNHMRLKDFYSYDRSCYTGGKRVVKRMITLFNGNIDLLQKELDLIDADNKSHSPEYCMENQVSDFRAIMKEVLSDKYYSGYFISGKEIIDSFQITQGPIIGKIKKTLHDIHIVFPRYSKESVIQYLKGAERLIPVMWINIKDSEKVIVSDNRECVKSGVGLEISYKFPSNLVGNIISVGSLYYPDLLISLYRDKLSREIIDNFADNMLSIGSFSEINVKIDLGYDLSACIDWEDGGKTSII